MRSKFFILGFLLLLGWFNWQVYQQEKARSTGTLVVLRLAPVDPRSLMQGDYMRLSYAIDSQISKEQERGTVFLKLDQDREVEEVLSDRAADTVALKFHRKNGRVLLGIESFLFQEGSAQAYEQAEFAEVKVSPDGTAHLIDLLDKNKDVITP